MAVRVLPDMMNISLIGRFVLAVLVCLGIVGVAMVAAFG
jgi:hypothetical protein